jgi:hypothetical protein
MLVLTAKLLVALASTVTLNSESHGTHYHILLSDGFESCATLASRSLPEPTDRRQTTAIYLNRTHGHGQQSVAGRGNP